jgi:hypothetical protein
MKKLIVLAALLATTQSFATMSVSNLFAYTIAEAIYSAAIPLASTGVTSAASQDRRKEAYKVQNDIQNYFQSGEISSLLQDKIQITQDIDNTLSTEESVDAISKATDLVLN